MTPLYAYSLIPVLSVALLLCFTSLFRTEDEWGLVAYCATVAVWVGSLLTTDASDTRRQFVLLAASGLLTSLGSWWNAHLLASKSPLPWGVLMVLGGMLLLTGVVRARQTERDRRLLESSLLYSAVAAFLSAGFLFGVVTLVGDRAEPLLFEYRAAALFLLFMAALAFEPLRQQLQSRLAGSLLSRPTDAGELADELAEQEKRADHHERLAEVGTFTSAIAHEVRNPLGVIRGCVRVLGWSAATSTTRRSTR